MIDEAGRKALSSSRRHFLKTAACCALFWTVSGYPSPASAQKGKKSHLGPKLSPYYQSLKDGKIQCQLCPRECIVPKGGRGFCGVRENRGGEYYSLVYGNPCAVHVDPVEKKPFFHLLPASTSFSIATAGCNFRCKFCQNWEISQVAPEETYNYELPPEGVVDLAKKCRREPPVRLGGKPALQSGTIAAALLLIVTVTGIYLLFFYRLGDPYASIARLTDQWWGGRWIRGLHRYASDAAEVAIGVHAIRLYAQGRSWGPRALAWVSGVSLLALVMICGWTGYVMIWDVQGQLLAQEGARLLDRLPIFSEPISRAFVSEKTLPSAFFFLNLFLHVALPIGLGLLLWVHVTRVARPVLLPPRRLSWTITAALTAEEPLRRRVQGPPKLGRGHLCLRPHHHGERVRRVVRLEIRRVPLHVHDRHPVVSGDARARAGVAAAQGRYLWRGRRRPRRRRRPEREAVRR